MIFYILILTFYHMTLAFDEHLIIDFSSPESVISSQWVEVSDTKRDVGLSKATLAIIESETDRRASLFTLLVPQPDGACFAGMNYVAYNTTTQKVFDISSYSTFVLDDALVTGIDAEDLKTENSIYKMILKDNNSNTSISFESCFTAPLTKTRIELNIKDFSCSYRGQSCPDFLNTKSITALGFQVACGVYVASSAKQKQSVSSMELISISIF